MGTMGGQSSSELEKKNRELEKRITKMRNETQE